MDSGPSPGKATASLSKPCWLTRAITPRRTHKRKLKNSKGLGETEVEGMARESAWPTGIVRNMLGNGRHGEESSAQTHMVLSPGMLPFCSRGENGVSLGCATMPLSAKPAWILLCSSNS